MGHVTLPITSRGPTDANEFADVFNNDNAIIQQVNGNLDSTNLTTDSVGTSEIQSLAVGATELATNAVATVKIQDGAVTSPKMVITSHEDTQSASISATGVLTGISITPGAGTFLAIATAQGAISSATTSAELRLSLRVNGVNVISGPTSGVADPDPEENGLVVSGLITPSAVQAVEVHGTFAGDPATISSGRLTLVRLA